MMHEMTKAERIANCYKAALDSVALINGGKPEDMKAEEWDDVVSRNKDHLRTILTYDFWTTEDMSAIQAVAV